MTNLANTRKKHSRDSKATGDYQNPEVETTHPKGAKDDRSRTIQLLIKSIPKVELHLHLEGTLEPELVFALAKRNGIDLSPYKNEEELRSSYEQFTDLDSFLKVYYLAASVLRTENDFYDLAIGYFARAHLENVVHAEVFFDPQCHKDRGISFKTCADGILRAMTDAYRKFGMSSKLIPCFLRHLPEESAVATWTEMVEYIRLHPGSKSRIVGVGLDSSEMDHPPRKFESAFRLVRNASNCGIGKMHVVAHAGEEGPPGYISEALDILHAERIDHGVRCLEDDTLVERLRMEQIPLTVCPISNLRLKVVDRLEHHNLRRMLDLNLNVSIHSDDPAYFGGYLIDNYVAVVDALGLNENDVITLAKNGIASSFLTNSEKEDLLNRLTISILGKLDSAYCEVAGPEGRLIDPQLLNFGPLSTSS